MILYKLFRNVHIILPVRIYDIYLKAEKNLDMRGSFHVADLVICTIKCQTIIPKVYTLSQVMKLSETVKDANDNEKCCEGVLA